MNIEIVEYDADEAMHPQHVELGVRVEHEEPLGPSDWPVVWKALDPGQQKLLGDACRVAVTSSHGSGIGRPCKFWVEVEHESDPKTTGYAQWWFFPKM